MIYIQKTCGLNIRLYRKAKGLTLNQMSQAVGITSSYLGYLERGQRNPSLDIIARIADVLEVRPYQLLLNNEDNFDMSLHKLLLMVVSRRNINEISFLKDVLKSYIKSINP